MNHRAIRSQCNWIVDNLSPREIVDWWERVDPTFALPTGAKNGAWRMAEAHRIAEGRDRSEMSTPVLPGVPSLFAPSPSPAGDERRAA